MFPTFGVVRQNNFYPLNQCLPRRRQHDLLDIRGYIEHEHHHYPHGPRDPRRGRRCHSELHGSYSGGMNGGIYNENVNVEIYHGGNYVNGTLPTQAVYSGLGGLARSRSDFIDRERNRYWRHRTDQQIRELQETLDYNHHLTQRQMEDLRWGTNERFEHVMALLRRHGGRIRREEGTHLRRRDRFDDPVAHRDDVRLPPRGYFPGGRTFREGAGGRYDGARAVAGSDSELDDEDFEYA